MFLTAKKTKSCSDYVLELESNTTLPSWYDGWTELNVTSAARRWSWYPNENMGLYMQLLDSKGELRRQFDQRYDHNFVLFAIITLLTTS